MKIIFTSENGYYGGVPRNYNNCRTEYAWQIALKTDHIPIDDHNSLEGLPEGHYDLGIIIIPKKKPVFDFDIFRSVCKRVAIMQEGPNWFWQDWDIPTQIKYVETLASMDTIYVHNISDKKYYGGLIDHPDVRVMRTLMIEDAIDKKLLCRHDQRSGAMIGGNFVSWYGGFDSYAIASEFGEPVYAPSMGRKQKDEDDIDGITYLPYLLWNEWIVELSKRKYGVHLMRTHAAGTFALNCAYLGIPCIGYEGLDTQEKCHPELTVKVGDLKSARKIAKHLNNTKQFYDSCSVIAKENYKIHFQEQEFIKNFMGND